MEYVTSNTSIALLGYIGIFLVSLLMLATLRVTLSLKGKKRANDFSPTGEDVSEFSRRLVRTHANMYEFFPVFGGLLLYALATGQTAVTNGLALAFLGARILQALIHLFSTSIMAVQIRFAFFLAQFVIAIIWILKFFGILA
ncbi:MAG: MAPEG family protein [Robiginitomaculum sp.]|nr:MAG: MAPEG family protein [Robiginitomaculum sp.]